MEIPVLSMMIFVLPPHLHKLLVVDLVVFILHPGSQQVRDALSTQLQLAVFLGGCQDFISAQIATAVCIQGLEDLKVDKKDQKLHF